MSLRVSVILHCLRCKAEFVTIDHHNPRTPIYPVDELDHVIIVGNVANCTNCGLEVGEVTRDGRVQLKPRSTGVILEILTGGI